MKKELLLLGVGISVLLVAGCAGPEQNGNAARNKNQRGRITQNAPSPGAVNVERIILTLEQNAMARWAQGDPSGFLQICDPDVAYFDPALEQRLDGLQALTQLYESLRGRIRLDRYEMVNPRVQLCGDGGAVLTYNFHSSTGTNTLNRWNCTEVYRRGIDGNWRIVQTHWSVTQPFSDQKDDVPQADAVKE